MAGLEIIVPKEEDVFTATERLCLTEPDENGEQRLVPEGSPEARWLFCAVGQEIPTADAEKYGLVKKPKSSAKSKKQGD
jgi:hypothetical protein